MKIKIDTREKIPWKFHYPDIQTEICKLDTADYTVDGLEDVLAIERKQHLFELVRNFTEKRFEKFLCRLSNFKYSFIICEFSYQNILDYPFGCGLPKKAIAISKAKPDYIIRCISRIQVKYGIHVLLCNSTKYAIQKAVAIMKEVEKDWTYEHKQNMHG